MELDIKKLRSALYVWVLIVLVYRFSNHILLHQLEQPLHFDPYIDVTMWIMISSGFSKFIVENYTVALLFDSVLFTITLLNVFYHRRFLSISFSIIFFAYLLLFNMYSTAHGHNLFAIVVFSFLFWFTKPKLVAYIWLGLRYYVAFVYLSAGVWKILRPSVWNIDYGNIILKLNNYEALYLGDAGFVPYLLENPILSYIVIFSGVLLELFFIVAFYTFKYDKILFVFVLAFHLGTYFLMDIHFFPFLIASLVFIPLSINDRSALDYTT